MRNHTSFHLFRSVSAFSVLSWSCWEMSPPKIVNRVSVTRRSIYCMVCWLSLLSLWLLETLKPRLSVSTPWSRSTSSHGGSIYCAWLSLGQLVLPSGFTCPLTLCFGVCHVCQDWPTSSHGTLKWQPINTTSFQGCPLLLTWSRFTPSALTRWCLVLRLAWCSFSESDLFS